MELIAVPLGPITQIAPAVSVALVDEHQAAAGAVLTVRRAGEHLSAERLRMLRDWLDAVLDGRHPGPANPDAVRLAVDQQRALLRGVSADRDASEDFRAGLAWGDRALTEIAAAATAATDGAEVRV